MPRPQSDIWVHFKELPARPGAQHKQAQCLSCSKIYLNAQPKRMINHLVNQCISTSSALKAKWAPYLTPKKSKQPRTRTPPSKPRTPQQRSGQTPQRARQTPHRPSQIAAASSPYHYSQAEFQIDVAFLVHAMGWSFRTVENPLFRNFMRKYLPQYTLPSRQHLADKLLTAVYQRERLRVIEALKTQDLMSLVTDGWTDANGDHLLNFIIVTPSLRPIYWSSVHTKDDSKTGSYIAKKIDEAIVDIENETGSLVRGLVSDNASAMNTASVSLRADGRKHILRVGCAAHVLNLVLEDVFKIRFFKIVREQAVSVAKYVKKRTILLARFRNRQRVHFRRQKGRRALALPVPTRWYSSHRCISSVLGNKQVIQWLFGDAYVQRIYGKCKKMPPVKQIVSSTKFWDDAKIVTKLIRPITMAMAELESDNCSISLVYEHFNRLLKNEVYKSESTEFKGYQELVHAVITDRWREHRVPAYNAAYLLDPMLGYDGFVGDDAQQAIIDAQVLAKELGYEGQAFASLKNEILRFAPIKKNWTDEKLQENREKFTVTAWWGTSSMKYLADFAQHILAVPASSAPSERSWSKFSHIQSPRRTRIDPSRLNTLMFVYSNAGKLEVQPNSKLYQFEAVYDSISEASGPSDTEPDYDETNTIDINSVARNLSTEDDWNDYDGDESSETLYLESGRYHAFQTSIPAFERVSATNGEEDTHPSEGDVEAYNGYEGGDQRSRWLREIRDGDADDEQRVGDIVQHASGRHPVNSIENTTATQMAKSNQPAYFELPSIYSHGMSLHRVVLASGLEQETNHGRARPSNL